MSKPIPEHALVVVADGGKALMFRRTGTGGTVHLREETELDSAGRVAETPSGSRPEDQSPKQTAEAGFVNHLAHRLKELHGHKKFTDLVVVADPQTLGQLRSAMHKTLESAVVRTVGKDLTNHSRTDIEAALSD